jgi:FkbM family methyltransferase
MPTLNRPDYVLQPAAVLRRLRTSYTPRGTGRPMQVMTAWGLPLEARTDESIGYALITTGVFDLPVTETLLRLAEPGELAIDVGANIGAMSSALAAAVGPEGEVWSFEPNPTVLEVLERSVAAWDRRVVVHPFALSDADGTSELIVSRVAGNQGLAHLGGDALPTDDVHEITTRRLDDLVGDRSVGVMKVDAEGHESFVLAGAPRLLAEGRVRDLVYEDLGGYPSPVSATLEAAGYRIWALGRTFLRPRLDPPTRLTAGEEGQSYLATRDPERAARLLGRRGWRALDRRR